jgi:hypothetical protein
VNIKKIARAAVVPTAIAGVTLSTGVAAYAALSDSPPPKVHHRADAAAQWVTVRSGQTLQGIAAAHDMSWQAIAGTPPNYLHLHYPYRVTPGEHLRIPADPRLRAAQFRAWQRRAAAARAAAAQRATAAAEAASQQQAAGQDGQQAAATQPSQQPESLQAVLASASSFEQCVAWRESTDTPTDPDGLFGILPSTWAELGYSGTAGEASVAQQQQAFTQLYAEYGAQPWAPSDGC